MTINNEIRIDSVVVVSTTTDNKGQGRIHFDGLPDSQESDVVYKRHLNGCDRVKNTLSFFSPFREKWKPLQVIDSENRQGIQTIYINTCSASKRLSKGKDLPFETKWMASASKGNRGNSFYGAVNAKIINDQLKKLSGQPICNAEAYGEIYTLFQDQFKAMKVRTGRSPTEKETLGLFNKAKAAYLAKNFKS